MLDTLVNNYQLYHNAYFHELSTPFSSMKKLLILNDKIKQFETNLVKGIEKTLNLTGDM